MVAASNAVKVKFRWYNSNNDNINININMRIRRKWQEAMLVKAGTGNQTTSMLFSWSVLLLMQLLN